MISRHSGPGKGRHHLDPQPGLAGDVLDHFGHGGGTLKARAEDDGQRSMPLRYLAVLSSVSQTVYGGEEPAQCLAMAGPRQSAAWTRRAT
jgi:hypothetical protein